MIALKSISPKHINGDVQALAINSWTILGLRVFIDYNFTNWF